MGCMSTAYDVWGMKYNVQCTMYDVQIQCMTYNVCIQHALYKVRHAVDGVQCLTYTASAAKHELFLIDYSPVQGCSTPHAPGVSFSVLVHPATKNMSPENYITTPLAMS
jgi:hypothetical protein